MVESLEVGVAGAGEGKPVVMAEQVAHLVEEAERIGVPRRDI